MADDLIPPKLRPRPRDIHGRPIPFTNLIRADGTPDFRVLDAEKVKKCAREKLCALCGTRLGVHVFFIGGDGSANQGIFTDGPMHKECAEFASRACPFVALEQSQYSQRTCPALPSGIKIIEMEEVSREKPLKMYLVKASQWTVRIFASRIIFICKVIDKIEIPQRSHIIEDIQEGTLNVIEDTHEKL